MIPEHFRCTACKKPIGELRDDVVLAHDGRLYFFHASGDCELAALEVARSSPLWHTTYRRAVGDEEEPSGGDVISLRGIE